MSKTVKTGTGGAETPQEDHEVNNTIGVKAITVNTDNQLDLEETSKQMSANIGKNAANHIVIKANSRAANIFSVVQKILSYRGDPNLNNQIKMELGKNQSFENLKNAELSALADLVSALIMGYIPNQDDVKESAFAAIIAKINNATAVTKEDFKNHEGFRSLYGLFVGVGVAVDILSLSSSNVVQLIPINAAAKAGAVTTGLKAAFIDLCRTFHNFLPVTLNYLNEKSQPGSHVGRYMKMCAAILLNLREAMEREQRERGRGR